MNDAITSAILALFTAGFQLIEKARAFAGAQGISPNELEAMEKRIADERAVNIDAARKAELEEITK